MGTGSVKKLLLQLMIPAVVAQIVVDKIAADEFKTKTVVALDRKSTRLNSSHPNPSRMPSSA